MATTQKTRAKAYQKEVRILQGKIKAMKCIYPLVEAGIWTEFEYGIFCEDILNG